MDTIAPTAAPLAITAPPVTITALAAWFIQTMNTGDPPPVANSTLLDLVLEVPPQTPDEAFTVLWLLATEWECDQDGDTLLRLAEVQRAALKVLARAGLGLRDLLDAEPEPADVLGA